MTRQKVAVPMFASTEQEKSRVIVIPATTLLVTGKHVQVTWLYASAENMHNFSLHLLH